MILSSSLLVSLWCFTISLSSAFIRPGGRLGRRRKTSMSVTEIDGFQVRPFSSSNGREDLAKLSEICKDVYDGTDYLPNMALRLEKDVCCDFVVMEENGETTDTTNDMMAVGNLRQLDSKGEVIWIEAIRVCPQRKGRGLATALMKILVQRSKDAGAKELLSCTVYDNHPMRTVFGKKGVDMQHVSNVYCADLSQLKTIPGWSSSSTETMTNDSEEGQGINTKCPNIFQGLKVEHLVSDKAKMQEWETVKSEKELKSILSDIQSNYGGSGHLPGFYKLLLASSDEIRNCIQKGLVRKKKILKGDKNSAPAIVVFTEEPAIQSLRSKNVCSIVATNGQDFDSALWDACRKENNLLLDDNQNNAFIFAYDGCLVDPSPLLDALPWNRDRPCVIYRREL